MKAKCGHEMCALCGSRVCDNNELMTCGKHTVCRSCRNAAIDEVVRLASRWFCDTSEREQQPCGNLKRG